jgi:hypothetical protein
VPLGASSLSRSASSRCSALCRKRLARESFAPDERDAIAQLAHGVGVALALQGARNASADAAPMLPIAALVAAIEALPDALAAKLQRDRAFAD